MEEEKAYSETTYKKRVRWFKERLNREGRFPAYHARLKELLGPLRRGAGSSIEDLRRMKSLTLQARREFGYDGAKEDILRQEYLDDLALGIKAQKQSVHRKRYMARKKLDDFEKQLKELPDGAPPAVELAWVHKHPAMTRKKRSVDPDEKIVVTVEDIRNAPSQQAAQTLAQFVNNPDKFFEIVLGEQKKELNTGDGSNGKDIVRDSGLATLKRVHEQLMAMETK